MKRNLRRNADLLLTGLGAAVIFTAVILGGSIDIVVQLPMALVGVLLMEAGVWGLSAKLFPSERRYNRLRQEGDRMIHLIRELNSAAIAKDTGQEDAKRFQQTMEAMHESVIRMSKLAGVADDEEVAEVAAQRD